jgi:sterol desaturase/sphingolipid hydroxylase (fatty acid hydroxylase superfamily)
LDHTVFNLINAAGILLLLALETRASVFRNVWRDGVRMRRNAAYLVLSVAVGMLLHRTSSFLAPLLPRLIWASWAQQLPGASLPVWLQLPGVFLLGELLNWLLHWAKHKNAFLWRLHCQHHKEDQYSVWLTTHTYAPEVLLSGTIITSLVLMAGFSRTALDCYLLFYSLANLYQHSALPHSLGFLDRLIINPAFHRQHHGGEQVNFGSTLTVWDWVFRTARWPAGRRDLIDPPSIDATPEPFGFVDEMLYPWLPSRWVTSQVIAVTQPAALSRRAGSESRG